MLSNSLPKRASFSHHCFVRLASKKRQETHFASTRRREDFLLRQMRQERHSYNRYRDPYSRKVYKKVEASDEDHYEKNDEIDYKFWKLTDKSIKEEQRQITKNIILKRKERARLGQREKTILTWAARTQIQYLHAQDPYQWTPEVLAESFPVSKDIIIAILKQTRLPENEADIERHDHKVYRNWLKLKSDLQSKKHSVPSLHEKKDIDNRISKIVNAAGIPSLPVPPENELLMTRKKLIEKIHPKVTGAFSAILSDYKAQFCNKDVGISNKHEKTAFAIGDQEAVQLLSTISSSNINEAIPEAETDKNGEEKLPEEGIQIRQSKSVSESGKSQQVISKLRQCRRMRKTEETHMTNKVKMEGFGKVS